MKWILPTDISVSDALREAVGGHPIVAETLARRGYVDPEAALAFLDPDRYAPAPPTALPNVEEIAERLLLSIGRQERLLVWGDFDVDGQTSTALLVDALTDLGAVVKYRVPHRLHEGHGIQPGILQQYIDAGIETLITCDTGIADHEAVDLARENFIEVIITDHHTPPPTLPNTPFITNPHLLPEGHPLRDLPGVGVAYKLMQALYELVGEPEKAERLLDLVALGIVADVAIQRRDTRYLLQRGIDQLRNSPRIGLQALIQSAGIDPHYLSADTIGYQIGPRLNALGRLDDATLAVTLLMTGDQAQARQIAAQLELLNNRRRQISDQIYAAAQDQIARDPSLLNFEALVLGAPRWHAGVLGIAAARLVEQYERPVILLTMPPGEPAHGSARSVPGIDIGAAIAANAELLLRYGGHPGAAGLSLDPDLIPQFHRRLSSTVSETWDHGVVTGVQIDARVSLGDLDMTLAEQIDRLAPFGAGNPPIHLMTPGVRLVAHAGFGRSKQHRRVTVENEEGVQQVVTWWGGSESPLPGPAFDLVYILRVNDYRGQRSLQLEWVDSRPVPGAVAVETMRRELIDRRDGPELATILADYPDAVVWAEGFRQSESPGMDRFALLAAPTLVVYTVPPGPRELHLVCEQVNPRQVIVIGHVPPYTTLRAFMNGLGGLCKTALRGSERDGVVSISEVAARLAQRECAVRRGLEWLEARSQIGLTWLDDDRVRIADGDRSTPDDQAREAAEESLRAILNETRAYRAHVQRAPLEAVFDF